MEIFNLRKVILENTIGNVSTEDFFLILKKLELAKNLYANYDRKTGNAQNRVPAEILTKTELRKLVELVADYAVTKNDIAAMSTCLRSNRKFSLGINLRERFEKIAKNF